MAGISFDLVTIPRWTIRRDAVRPVCSDCRSVIVRVLADRRHMAFCVCRMHVNEFIPRL